MNNTRFFAGILAALVTTLATPSSHAAYVPGVTINAVSSEFFTATDSRRATNLVNDVAMFGDFISSAASATMWLTTNAAAAKPGTNSVTFDLGLVRPLKAMHVWNYNEVLSGANILVRRGIARADISVAGEDLVFTTNLTDAVFTAAPGLFTNNFMQAFDFGGISARYVRISVRTNHGELGVDPAVGLSKVRFVDTNVPPRLDTALRNYSSNKVTVLFSEPVTAATATNIANYSIRTDGTNSAAILSAAIDLYNNRIALQTTLLTNTAYSILVSNVASVSDGTVVTNGSAANIESEVALWLRADAGVTADGGGLVSQWADQSPSGNNAAQAIAVFQPTLVAGALNSQPVVRFSGAAGFTNYLEVANSSTLRFASGDMSVFAVMNFQTFNSFNTIISQTHPNTQPAPIDAYVRATGQPTFLRGAGWGNSTVNGLTNLVIGQPYVLSFISKGTNATEYLNGAFNNSVAALTGVGNVGTSLTLGARPQPNFGTKFNGDIAEIILIRGAASDEDRLAIHNYLGSKYGISIISLVFNQQPTNTTKLEGQIATFRVNVTANSPNIVYQWQRYGTNLPSATNATYTTPLLTQADNNSTFRVQVSIPGNSQFSDTATLTVLPDTELPTVISAGRRIWSPSEIVVVYSESVLASTATNIGNYVLDNGATVTGATIGDSPNRVVLSTTGLTNGGSYSLTVQNVKDLYNNTIVTALINIGIHPVPALWLRADQGVITNASGFVTEWDDQSGNANHATPFGGDETLPLLTNGFNNSPVLRFGYTDLALTTNYLACNPSESLALVGDMSMYCIASFVDYGNHRTLVSKATLNQAAPFDAYMLSGTGQQRLVRGNGTASSIITGTTAPSVKTPHVVYSTSKDNFVSHYLDGITNGTGTVNLTPTDSGSYLFIGHRFTDGATTMKGDIAELLLFGTSLSDADRAAMDLYFAGKYNLVIGAVPRLSLSLTNSNSLVLSWPTPTVSFGLESANDLSGATWSAVTNSVTSSGGTNSVVVTAGGIQQYYRLHKQ